MNSENGLGSLDDLAGDRPNLLNQTANTIRKTILKTLNDIRSECSDIINNSCKILTNIVSKFGKFGYKVFPSKVRKGILNVRSQRRKCGFCAICDLGNRICGIHACKFSKLRYERIKEILYRPASIIERFRCFLDNRKLHNPIYKALERSTKSLKNESETLHDRGDNFSGSDPIRKRIKKIPDKCSNIEKMKVEIIQNRRNEIERNSERSTKECGKQTENTENTSNSSRDLIECFITRHDGGRELLERSNRIVKRSRLNGKRLRESSFHSIERTDNRLEKIDYRLQEQLTT